MVKSALRGNPPDDAGCVRAPPAFAATSAPPTPLSIWRRLMSMARSVAACAARGNLRFHIVDTRLTRGDHRSWLRWIQREKRWRYEDDIHERCGCGGPAADGVRGNAGPCADVVAGAAALQSVALRLRARASDAARIGNSPANGRRSLRVRLRLADPDF